MDFLMYLVLGACSGVLAGLFGIGGGLIIVPVLVFSFAAQGVSEQVLTHLAVGTSLAAILFTSINSVLAHHKKGAVLWHLVVWLAGGILIGSALGVYEYPLRKRQDNTWSNKVVVPLCTDERMQWVLKVKMVDAMGRDQEWAYLFDIENPNEAL